MRAVDRLLGLLLGVALAAGGALAAVNGVLALLDRPPWPIRFDRWQGPLVDAQLRDRSVLAVAVGVGVLGLVLLVAQLWPRAPRQLAVAGAVAGADQGSWWVQRRSAEHRLATAVDTVSGVSGGRARLRGRGSRWRLRVSARGRADVRPAMEETIRTELAALAAPEAVRLRVSLRTPRGRV